MLALASEGKKLASVLAAGSIGVHLLTSLQAISNLSRACNLIGDPRDNELVEPRACWCCCSMDSTIYIAHCSAKVASMADTRCTDASSRLQPAYVAVPPPAKKDACTLTVWDSRSSACACSQSTDTAAMLLQQEPSQASCQTWPTLAACGGRSSDCACRESTSWWATGAVAAAWAAALTLRWVTTSGREACHMLADAGSSACIQDQRQSGSAVTSQAAGLSHAGSSGLQNS